MKPSIFFLSEREIGGGILKTYEQVDILNSVGLKAFVVHKEEKSESWFKNKTPVIDYKKMESLFNLKTDYLVVPENHNPLPPLAVPAMQVVFNQSPIYGLTAMGEDLNKKVNKYNSKVKAVITVSPESKSIVKAFYPNTPVHAIKLSVNSKLFKFKKLENKKKQILISPKNWRIACSAAWMLKSRASQGKNCLSGYKFIIASGLPQKKMAKALSDSVALIFLGHEEGFGLMPLEAALSGCLVAALEAAPVTKHLPKEYVFRHGDFLRLVLGFEKLIEVSLRNTKASKQIIEKAYKTALKFNKEAERSSVLQAWSKILKLKLE